MPSTSRGSSKKLPQSNNIEGWIGHALDPLGVLFDTLMEASINTEDPTPTGIDKVHVSLGFVKSHSCVYMYFGNRKSLQIKPFQ